MPLSSSKRFRASSSGISSTFSMRLASNQRSTAAASSADRTPLAREAHGEAERGFDLVQELLAEPIDYGLVFRHVFVAVEDYEHGLPEGSHVLAQQVGLVRALLGEVR